MLRELRLKIVDIVIELSINLQGADISKACFSLAFGQFAASSSFATRDLAPGLFIFREEYSVLCAADIPVILFHVKHELVADSNQFL